MFFLSLSSKTIRLSIVFFLCLVFGPIFSCPSVAESPRKNEPELEVYKAKANWLDDLKVVGVRFKDVPYVKQADTDLCWAACLEQALVFQGVDTDQKRILEKVYHNADSQADKTINRFQWSQYLTLTRERLSNGAEVWTRLDMDGGGIWPAQSLPITSIQIFKRKIFRELDWGRIPIIGISTENGTGHMYTIIGMVTPEFKVKQNETIRPDDIVAFWIYNPLTARRGLFTAEYLFEAHDLLVYITIFNTGTGAALGLNHTTLKQY